MTKFCLCQVSDFDGMLGSLPMLKEKELKRRRSFTMFEDAVDPMQAEIKKAQHGLERA